MVSYWSSRTGGPHRWISRRTTIKIGALSGTAAFLAACGGGSDDDAGSSPSSSNQTGTSSGTQAAPALSNATLRSGIGSDVGSLDPQSLAGTGGGNWPSYSIHFVGLMRTDTQKAATLPYMAESVEWVEQGKTVVARLRPGMTFHNGDPVTAEDVKFSYDRIIGKAAYNSSYNSGLAGQYRTLGGVEVVDPLTVRFTLSQTDVIFLNRLTTYVLPKKYIESAGDDGFAKMPIGTGPFKFVSRVADSEIKSERFEQFFAPITSDQRPRMPVVKSLVQRVIPENEARIAALEAGEIDVVHNVATDQAKQLEKESGYQVLYLPGDQPMHIHINTVLERDPDSGQPNPWRDVRVRRAANMAVDLDTIIKTIMTGKEQRSFGSSSYSFGFPEDIKSQQFKYDPQQAKQLLAAAGYASGFDATISDPIGRWPNSREISEAIAGYLNAVGIRTKLQQLQYQVVTTRFKDRSLPHLTFWGMSGGPDAASNFRNGYHSTAAYTMSPAGPEMDRMIEASEAELDPEKRKVLVGNIIRTFYQEAHWIFLHEPVTVAAMGKKWKWEPQEKVLSNLEYWAIRPA